MSAGRHRRDGQLSDTWRAAARAARKRLRRGARNLLWAAGDWLCARPLTFPAGNWLGELGWTLSGPFRLTPAPEVRRGQAPRLADPPRKHAARCGPGQPPAPGLPLLAAGTAPGTPAPGAAPGQAPDAGAAPAPAAVATIPLGGAATLPRPETLRTATPGPGQHPQRKAWVIHADDHPLPRQRGDYRPTEPMRAVGGTVACNIIRPFYPALEARRDSTARWGA